MEVAEEERLALANRVLDELHPTSAVCGMPKHQALEFILAHEGYDRQFYSGFLGPVHMEGRSSLFVNLRCMQLAADYASLYVGGGITAQSDPASESRDGDEGGNNAVGAQAGSLSGRPMSDTIHPLVDLLVQICAERGIHHWVLAPAHARPR